MPLCFPAKTIPASASASASAYAGMLGCWVREMSVYICTLTLSKNNYFFTNISLGSFCLCESGCLEDCSLTSKLSPNPVGDVEYNQGSLML